MTQKKYSSSLSRHAVESETKPNTKLNWSCFVSNLTNPINKMFVTLIYYKKNNFSQSQNNFCQRLMSRMKHQVIIFIKSDKMRSSLLISQFNSAFAVSFASFCTIDYVKWLFSCSPKWAVKQASE